MNPKHTRDGGQIKCNEYVRDTVTLVTATKPSTSSLDWFSPKQDKSQQKGFS